MDLILDLYQKLWDDIPSSEELGSQVYLNAASIGNTEVMMQVSISYLFGEVLETLTELAADSHT